MEIFSLHAVTNFLIPCKTCNVYDVFLQRFSHASFVSLLLMVFRKRSDLSSGKLLLMFVYEYFPI